MYRQCIMGNYNIEIEGVGKREVFLEKFKPFINHQNISKINSIMNDAFSYGENANPKILMLDISIKLYKLLRTNLIYRFMKLKSFLKIVIFGLL